MVKTAAPTRANGRRRLHEVADALATGAELPPDQASLRA